MKQDLLLSLIFVYSIGSLIAQNRPIQFSNQLANDSIYLHAKNVYPCPFYLKPKLKKESYKNQIWVQAAFLLMPHAKKNIARFPKRAFTDSLVVFDEYLSVPIIMGNPLKSNVDHHFYTLPFTIGACYKVIQGYNGKLSHYSDWSRYAIDFAMPEKDTICAARGGVVCWVVANNTVGGQKKSFLSKTNVVVIYHEDGSFAYYSHLAYKGALVAVGDRIQQGQPIALSGNTGYSTRPHLHFVVRTSTLEGLKSIPVHIIGLPSKKKFRSGYLIKRKNKPIY